MDISVGQLIVWLIIGALAGSLAGWVIKGRKRGYGAVRNIFLGLIGAVVGGILFDILDIRVGGDIVLTFSDLVAAFVGSLLVIGLVTASQRR